jgi:chemotaxis signal transduction protein
MSKTTSSLQFVSPPLNPKPELLVLEITIAGQRYAIAADGIQKVLPIAAWTLQAGLPEHVVGILELEGQGLPVVNARVCLGFDARLPSIDDHLLLVQASSVFFLWIDQANMLRPWLETDHIFNLEVFEPVVSP